MYRSSEKILAHLVSIGDCKINIWKASVIFISQWVLYESFQAQFFLKTEPFHCWLWDQIPLLPLLLLPQDLYRILTKNLISPNLKEYIFVSEKPPRFWLLYKTLSKGFPTKVGWLSTKKNNQVIQSALFWMVKWPFQRLSDLQLGDQKVTAWITLNSFFSRFVSKSLVRDFAPVISPSWSLLNQGEVSCRWPRRESGRSRICKILDAKRTRFRHCF